MVLHEQRTPLRLEARPAPEPGPGQLLLRVQACAVCRTDLHIVDGELTRPKLPLIPGHQIVATVEQGGSRFARGARVGVGWLGWTDNTCRFCREGRYGQCLGGGGCVRQAGRREPVIRPWSGRALWS